MTYRHVEQEWTSAYVDGEMTPQELAQFTSHMGVCVECRREVQSLRDVKIALSSSSRPGTPPHVRRAALSSSSRRALPAALLDRLERRYSPAASGWERLWNWVRVPRVWVPAGTLAAALASALLWMGGGLPSFTSQDVLPLEALVAAHARYNAEGLTPRSDMANSDFSSRLAACHVDG